MGASKWIIDGVDQACGAFPTRMMASFLFGIPAAISLYVGVGFSIFGLLTYFLIFALTALPIFAVFMQYISNYQCNTGNANVNEWVDFVNESDKKKYQNQKIPMEHFIEMYMNSKVELKEDLYTTLMKRHQYVTFGLTWGHIWFFLKNLVPETLVHSMSQDKQQVREHYDRGDDFYNSFLGPRMIYTSAMYDNEDETLEQGQDRKMKTVCEKIQLKKGEKHLDIGCGWGTLAVYAAKNYGSDSTGVTLAENQTEYATARAKEAGVSKNCRVLCMDYRDIPNTKYDKITCLEMAEHVGIRKFQTFLLQVKDMLNDDGLFYLQIAGLRRTWQWEDFNWGLFMGKYVFPGADASCPLTFVVYQLEKAGFEVHTQENVGVHYSLTIKHWYDNWVSNAPYIRKTYGEWWFRCWEVFLAWSVICAGQGWSTCHQLVCHKNTNTYNRKVHVGHRP